MKRYINNLKETFNDKPVIVYCDDSIDLNNLYSRFEIEKVEYITRFVIVKCNRLFYIKGKRLQIVATSSELYGEVVKGKTVVQLGQDNIGYYINDDTGVYE